MREIIFCIGLGLLQLTAMTCASFANADDVHLNVSAASQASYWDYREYINGSEFIHTYSPFVGIGSDVIFGVKDRIEIKASGSAQRGSGCYDGQTQGGLPLQSRDINDIFEIGAVARGFLPIAKTDAKLTVGSGYRYRRLDHKNLPESDVDYSRQISYHYIPVELGLSMPIGKKFSLGLAVEYRHFLEGTVKSKLSDVTATVENFPDFVNKQEIGRGIAASATFTYSPESSSWSVFAQPYYHQWDIGQSNDARWKDMVFTEPANTTREAGLKLGGSFDFFRTSEKIKK